MGMHADGEVFYGHDLGDLCNEHFDYIGPAWLEDDETTWEDKLAAVRGVEVAPYPRHIGHLPDDERRAHPDFVAWSEGRDRVHALGRESPVELATYGHEAGDRTWCVRVKASVVRATYDCVPLDLTGGSDLDPEWDFALLAFVQELELPTSGGPRWYLTSSYG